jgi:hypothetical protein
MKWWILLFTGQPPVFNGLTFRGVIKQLGEILHRSLSLSWIIIERQTRKYYLVCCSPEVEHFSQSLWSLCCIVYFKRFGKAFQERLSLLIEFRVCIAIARSFVLTCKTLCSVSVWSILRYLKPPDTLANATVKIIRKNHCREVCKLMPNTHLSSALAERIKELNCLYGISNLLENQDVTLGWILTHAVSI